MKESVKKETEQRGPDASDQERMAAWFREHWDRGIAFNNHIGIKVRRWEHDGVELELPFKDDLSAHEGIFHGGVVAALIDTAGSAAVFAGHDYSKGSRLSTVSMAVNYLAAAPFEDLVAYARATKRGRQVHYAEISVKSASGKLLAQGLVTVLVSGDRPGAPTTSTK